MFHVRLQDTDQPSPISDGPVWLVALAADPYCLEVSPERASALLLDAATANAAAERIAAETPDEWQVEVVPAND